MIMKCNDFQNLVSTVQQNQESDFDFPQTQFLKSEMDIQMPCL